MTCHSKKNGVKQLKYSYIIKQHYIAQLIVLQKKIKIEKKKISFVVLNGSFF